MLFGLRDKPGKISRKKEKAFHTGDSLKGGVGKRKARLALANPIAPGVVFSDIDVTEFFVHLFYIAIETWSKICMNYPILCGQYYGSFNDKLLEI